MRIYLRNLRTGQYLEKPDRDGWTDRPDRALAFATGVQAISVACEMKCKDVELLLAFEDPHYDIRVPLHTRFSEDGA
jgi:hypothetical protein